MQISRRCRFFTVRNAFGVPKISTVSKVYFSSLHIKIYTIINLILVGFTRRVDQGLGWGEICVKYESNKCLSENKRYIVNVNMHSYL